MATVKEHAAAALDVLVNLEWRMGHIGSKYVEEEREMTGLLRKLQTWAASVVTRENDTGEASDKSRDEN